MFSNGCLWFWNQVFSTVIDLIREFICTITYTFVATWICRVTVPHRHREWERRDEEHGGPVERLHHATEPAVEPAGHRHLAEREVAGRLGESRRHDLRLGRPRLRRPGAGERGLAEGAPGVEQRPP